MLRHESSGRQVLHPSLFSAQSFCYADALFIVQDLHMVELEDFKYGGTNITAFRLVDPNDELVQVKMMMMMLMLMTMMMIYI